jgi:hypothetical protein
MLLSHHSDMEKLMKKTHWLFALLLAGAMPAFAAAPESCERVKDDIQQKIVTNGVPESGFTLNIVPNDQADKPDARWSGIAPTTPLKFSTPATATISSSLRLHTKDIIPGLTGDNISIPLSK